MNWNDQFAARTTHMKRSTIREILKLTQSSDVISFAGGLPAPELFPVEELKAAATRVLEKRSTQALQYGATEGINELRDFIAAQMSRQGLRVTRDHILIVSGAQQAIDLIGRVLLDDGDCIAVENPTYMGMLGAWRPYSLRYSVLPTDANGCRVESLSAALQHGAKLTYLVPNFQNPQGVTLSHARRLELVRQLARFGGIVVEDNPYGHLRYSGEDIPSLYELDAKNLGLDTLDGHVIYLGSYSKILAPGLRLGWVAAPLPVIDRLVQAKQSADLHTGTFVQWVTYEALQGDWMREHVARLRETYRQRRDVMLAALEREFPAEIRWSHPEGGMFLMVYLPDYVDAGEILKEAIRAKVAFVPGEDFHVSGGKNTFRLNFSTAPPEMIEEGIHRLGKLLREVVQPEPERDK